MNTLHSTPVRGSNDTYGNSLVSELLGYSVTYDKAKKGVSKDNPFLSYYVGAEGPEVEFPSSVQDAANSPHPLYIVAPDNPVESFSLLERKVLPNTLNRLSKNALRSALGALLDAA